MPTSAPDRSSSNWNRAAAPAPRSPGRVERQGRLLGTAGEHHLPRHALAVEAAGPVRPAAPLAAPQATSASRRIAAFPERRACAAWLLDTAPAGVDESVYDFGDPRSGGRKPPCGKESSTAAPVSSGGRPALRSLAGCSQRTPDRRVPSLRDDCAVRSARRRHETRLVTCRRRHRQRVRRVPRLDRRQRSS